MPLAPAAPFPVDEESPEKEFLYTLNFGPQHPATHTTLRLILTLDGETVVRAVPDIGFLHSGFEKLGEELDYNQYVTIVDRMNYISPVANEVAWHHAIEKLLGIELTPRCQYIRVLFAELMRIHDHLLACGLEIAEPAAQWSPERREVPDPTGVSRDGRRLPIRLSDHAPVEALFDSAAGA